MTPPIRILHLITKLELGGAQRNTLYTANHLQEYGYEVHLWYGPGGILTCEAEKHPGHWCVPSLKRQINPLQDGKAYCQLIRQLRLIAPDIIHTHSSKAGFLGRMAARRVGVPGIVHSVHGYPFSPYQSPAKRWLFQKMEILAGKWTTHFVFVSEGDRETALQLGLCKQNHTLIHSGFPITDYTPNRRNRQSLRRRFKIPPGAAVIGTIAPFKPQKGLHHLVDIASHVTSQADVVFFIAGDGSLRADLEQRIRSKGLAAQFRLPGFLFDLPEVMDLFDVGVSTSLWEGLPQSLVQMRLKQIPLVVSDISGNNEVIRHDENGFLVKTGEHKLFAHYILKLIHDGQTRRALATAAEDFSSWDATHMVAQQDRLYKKLLNKIDSDPPQESQNRTV